MSRTAVAILDRDDWQANADILVVADDQRRTLTWLPRDLWSPRHHCRIGAAFSEGGVERLLDALSEAGFACDGLVCLRRRATETAFRDVVAEVPVRRRLDFWYPLEPNLPIEDGRKPITFMPPTERLSGERIHQWIGARIGLDGGGSDLLRIKRQQVLLRALLASHADFASTLRDPELVWLAGKDPLARLRTVDVNWRMSTLRGVFSRTIDGRDVLVRGSWGERLYRRLRRALGRRLAARRGDQTIRSGIAARSVDALAWGRHVSDAFEAKLRAICARLELDPSTLMTIIAFETGRSFSPAARNAVTGATGLLQFMPETAKRLGTTTAELAVMSQLQQLDYVERYLKPYAGRMPSLASAYMAVLWPTAVSEPVDFVLFAAPSAIYARNAGLDADQDGKVTKLDAAGRVQRYLYEGLAPQHAR